MVESGNGNNVSMLEQLQQQLTTAQACEKLEKWEAAYRSYQGVVRKGGNYLQNYATAEEKPAILAIVTQASHQGQWAKQMVEDSKSSLRR